MLRRRELTGEDITTLRRSHETLRAERDAARQTLAVLLRPGLSDRKLTDAAIAAAIAAIGSMIPANVNAADAARATGPRAKRRRASASGEAATK